jgi:hypothetical protein
MGPNAMMYIVLAAVIFDLLFLIAFTRTAVKPAPVAQFE